LRRRCRTRTIDEERRDANKQRQKRRDADGVYSENFIEACALETTRAQEFSEEFNMSGVMGQ